MAVFAGVPLAFVFQFGNVGPIYRLEDIFLRQDTVSSQPLFPFIGLGWFAPRLIKSHQRLDGAVGVAV